MTENLFYREFKDVVRLGYRSGPGLAIEAEPAADALGNSIVAVRIGRSYYHTVVFGD